jgi:hypothetical protein
MGFDIHYGKVKNKSKLVARENVFKNYYQFTQKVKLVT